VALVDCKPLVPRGIFSISSPLYTHPTAMLSDANNNMFSELSGST